MGEKGSYGEPTFELSVRGVHILYLHILHQPCFSLSVLTRCTWEILGVSNFSATSSLAGPESGFLF